jgi:hypothetical protein
MTTRHVSAQNDYPFHPVSDALRPVAKGILDVYFVIQGAYQTFSTDTSSAEESSSEELVAPDLAQLVRLIHYEDLGTTTRYTFRAEEGLRYWLITFTVPNTGNDIGQVSNDDGSECRAVLIYNSDLVMQATASVNLLVEPGRAQFHTEQVDSLNFFNIWRCNGEESSDSSLEVLSLPGDSSGEMSLELINGYNTEWTYDDSLEVVGGVGLGLGVVPDAGNTAPGCSSSAEDPLDLTNVVATINGILPTDGNIPIQVSRSIGKQRSAGRIELIIRNQ